VTTMPADTPTIVFVHGAWADASGFSESVGALRDRGFAAIGFANPLRHLTGDAAYLATPEGPRAWAASHASMVSQPEAVTQLILNAVEETNRSRT